jgi:hypothetical protein
MWACGAAGSALPWHGRGHRFDPDQVHQTTPSRSSVCGKRRLPPFHDFVSFCVEWKRNRCHAHILPFENRPLAKQKTSRLHCMNFCNISPWKLHHRTAALRFLNWLNQDNCANRLRSFENRIEIVHLVPGILSAEGIIQLAVRDKNHHLSEDRLQLKSSVGGTG